MNYSAPNPYGMSQINPMMGSGYGMPPTMGSGYGMPPIMGSGMGINPSASCGIPPNMGSGMGMKPYENSGINSFPAYGMPYYLNGNVNCFNNNFNRYERSKKKMNEDD